MIEFNEFLKNRNLSLANFADMSYEDLSSFCIARGVQPLTRSEFQASKPSPVLSIDFDDTITVDLEPDLILTATVAKQVSDIDFSKLAKTRKSTIQGYCDERNIEYSADNTKKELISLLKDYEGVR